MTRLYRIRPRGHPQVFDTLIDHGVEPRAQDASEPVRDAMGIGMPTGVDGAHRAAGNDPGGGGRVMNGQLQGAGDVVSGPGRDDGQGPLRCRRRGLTPRLTSPSPPADCQGPVQPGGDTGQGAVARGHCGLVGEVDHLVGLDLQPAATSAPITAPRPLFDEGLMINPMRLITGEGYRGLASSSATWGPFGLTGWCAACPAGSRHRRRRRRARIIGRARTSMVQASESGSSSPRRRR